MRKPSLTMILLLTGVITLGSVLPASARRGPFAGQRGLGDSRLQLVFEGGAVLPGGDLGDDFVGTQKGLGAGTGFELGGRLRYWLSPQTAVGPAFHYANFGDWNDVTFDRVPYQVRTEVYRWGVDLQQFLGDDPRGVRPYLIVGAALCHNRYEDWVSGDGTFLSSSNNLAFGVGGGVAMGPVELSAVWTFNRGENRELPMAPEVTDFDSDWSYLAVRAGLAF